MIFNAKTKHNFDTFFNIHDHIMYSKNIELLMLR